MPVDFDNFGEIFLSFLINCFCLRGRYAHDEESAEDQEETGWKYIHGDVFRFPKFKSFFAAALGSGTQLFTLYVTSGSFQYNGLTPEAHLCKVIL